METRAESLINQYDVTRSGAVTTGNCQQLLLDRETRRVEILVCSGKERLFSARDANPILYVY